MRVPIDFGGDRIFAVNGGEILHQAWLGVGAEEAAECPRVSTLRSWRSFWMASMVVRSFIFEEDQPDSSAACSSKYSTARS